MNVPFLVSNILSGVGMLAMLASTALRSRRKILAVQSVNHALSMAACSLLRGWSGAVQEAVNLVRDLAILQFGKLNRFWQISFVAAALGLGAAVTFAGGFQWYGLLPVLATALYSAVVVHPRCNARWIKASTAVCTMMWAVYSLFIRNYVYVLTNVITSKDEGALATALVRVKDSGITVLTAGTIPPNPTELLSAPMTEKIFASLQKAFDYVIVDTPPVSLVTDAAVLCRMADGVLLVVRPGVTTIQSAQLSKKNLEAVNAHILGVVMNGYNGKQSGRRDGYSYAYSYSYYDEDKKGNDA